MSLKKIRLLTLALLLALTVFRLYMALSLPLASDETNYWQWSRHPDFGYYDQGPMVAWTTWLGTVLAGQTALGVRLGAIVLTLACSGVAWLFAVRIFKDEKLGLWLILALNSTMLFTANGFIHTYDVEQVFFWLLGLYWAARAMFNDKPNHWYLAGLAAGLGMLSKYTSVLLPAFLLGFVAFTPSMRHWLKKPQPYLACLIAAAVYLPNLIWNATHNWAAFRHTLGMGGGDFIFNLPEFVGTQAAYVGPVLFVLTLIGLWAAWKQARQGEARQALLLWTSVPILVLFSLWSIKSRVYGNWTAPGWPAAIIAAVYALKDRLTDSRKWRRWGAAALIVGYLMMVGGAFHVPIIRAIGLPGKYDPTMEIYGWQEMGREIDKTLAAWPGDKKPFIFGLRYQMASLAAFYTTGQPWTKGLFLPGERLSVYVFWTDPRLLKGREGLGVIDLRNTHGHDPNLGYLFDKVEKIKDLKLIGPAGNIINHVGLYRCQGFKGRDARPKEYLSMIRDDG